MVARGPKTPGARFSEKNVLFFEIQWTSDTSMGSVSLQNLTFGLCGISTIQTSFYKVN